MITPKNIIKHELVGLRVEIVKSKDPTKVGVTGKIVNETKNMFIIETSKGAKKLPKAESVFRFQLEKSKVEVDGKMLVGKPEERIRKKISKW